MKRTFLLISLILNLCYCKSQSTKNNIYLIQGSSQDIITDNYSTINKSSKIYLLQLCKIVNDSVVVMDTLNYKNYENVITTSIMHNSFDKYFYIEQKVIIEEGDSNYVGEVENISKNRYITILDYGNNITIRKHSTFTDETFVRGYKRKLILSHNNDSYILNDWDDKLSESNKFGVDKNFNRIKLTPFIFEFPISNGAYGFQGEYYPKYFRDGNKFRISVRIDSDSLKENPILRYSLPDSLIFGKYLHILFDLPTSDYSVCRFSNCDSILIYNKKTKSWQVADLDINVWRCANYGNWICGTLINLWKYSGENDYKVREDSLYYFDRYYSYRYSQNGDFIPQLGCIPGKLFFFNIKLNKIIFFDTKDRDSEILDIVDNWVYYRKYDELRKFFLNPISNEIEYSKDVLISKNKKIIPFVHFIFISDKSTIVEEEIN